MHTVHPIQERTVVRVCDSLVQNPAGCYSRVTVVTVTIHFCGHDVSHTSLHAFMGNQDASLSTATCLVSSLDHEGEPFDSQYKYELKP